MHFDLIIGAGKWDGTQTTVTVHIHKIPKRPRLLQIKNWDPNIHKVHVHTEFNSCAKYEQDPWIIFGCREEASSGRNHSVSIKVPRDYRDP